MAREPEGTTLGVPTDRLLLARVHDHQRERGGFSPEATAESGAYDCRGGTGGEARRDLFSRKGGYEWQGSTAS